VAQLPEFVRRRVLFQHEVLRALLRRLAHAAERTLRGDLRDAERTLHDVLEVHVRQEEATLAPLLRARWDPDRLARLHANHCTALDALQMQRTRAPNESATASQRLVLRMLAAMAAEERDLLGVGVEQGASRAEQFDVPPGF